MYPEGVTGNEKYFNPDTEAVCEECGSHIDLDVSIYSVSVDGERFCCSSCRLDVAQISVRKGKEFWHAEANHGSILDGTLVTVECMGRTKKKSIREITILADIMWESMPVYMEG